MKRIPALLAVIVGVAIVFLSVSCGGEDGAQEAEQVAQPAAQPQQEADEEQAELKPPPNRAPIANAGADGHYDLGERMVVLNGNRSRDPDGDRLTYEWIQTAGSAVALRNAASVEASFESPRAEQRLTFQLRVTDGSGASDTDSLTFSFVNARPTAKAGFDRQIGRGEEFTLRGAGSDDASEDSLTYTWSQTSGPRVDLSDAAAATPSFTVPDELGMLVFSLTVNDGEHDSGPDTVTITIRNRPPVADAGASQTVSQGARVILNGSKSRDVDGDRITYEWTQISGGATSLDDPTGARPSFMAPQKAQNLIFQLVVSDGTEKSPVDTVHITVKHKPVVVSNFEAATTRTPVLYRAKEDAFTGDIRTDVRMLGPSEDLLLDVVCFESGALAIGFWLLDFERPERDADVPRQLEVIWRLNTGAVHRETLDVVFLGDTPAVYFRSADLGFVAGWPQVLDGGSLAVRISYRGVNEEVFDLDAFARTPVHGNLVNCGSY